MVRNKVVYAFLREDGSPFYIGMGGIKRAKDNGKGSRNYRWWEEQKSNPDRKATILYRSLTKQEAWDKEIDLIKFFGRQHIDDNGILTNIHPGGSFYGDHVTTSVVAFDLKGNRIAKFDSQGEAADAINRGHQGSISDCCKYKSKSIYGNQWFYESEVGDIDYVGPVKRQKNSGSNNTSIRFYFDYSDLSVTKGKRNGCRKYNIPQGSKDGTYFLTKFLEITKEEYYYLQELIKL